MEAVWYHVKFDGSDLAVEVGDFRIEGATFLPVGYIKRTGTSTYV